MEIDIKEKLNEFLLYTKSLMEAMRSSTEGNEKDNLRYSSYKAYMRKYNQLLENISKIQKIDSIVDYFNLENVLSQFDSIPGHHKEYFDSVYLNLSILKSYLENILGLKKSEVLILKDFFQSNLRKAVFKEPQNEKEVQDIIEQLLIGKGFSKGIDYDRETGRVKISAKEVIPDFILPKLNTALEVKYSTGKTKSKAIIDEINADIQSYSKNYESILFIIYDLGSIRDEDEFKNDLDNSDNINLVIIKH